MRVLVVHSGLMLTEGIEDILTREKDFRVKGITTRERIVVLQEIAVFRPDILILSDRPKPGDLSLLFEKMKGSPDPRIILVNKHNNSLLIFEKKEIEVTQAADLINAVRSRQLPPQLRKEGV